MSLSSKSSRITAYFLIFVLVFVACHNQNRDRSNFDIEKGNALVSLKQFASQAKVEIRFNSVAVSDVKTRAVKGNMSNKEALELLLQDTDLNFRYDRSSPAYIITRSELYIGP